MVVSADAYQQRRPDVIVRAVTSQILRPARALGEALISDWQGAGLLKASLIKPVLSTIEQRLTLRKLGVLQGDDVQALRSILGQILGSGLIQTIKFLLDAYCCAAVQRVDTSTESEHENTNGDEKRRLRWLREGLPDSQHEKSRHERQQVPPPHAAQQIALLLELHAMEFERASRYQIGWET